MKALLACLLLATAPCLAQEPPRAPFDRLRTEDAPPPDPWFSTFSIIAFDPATSELGVGVQSRAFAAGAAVPWAVPGVVAAIATAARVRIPTSIRVTLCIGPPVSGKAQRH